MKKFEAQNIQFVSMPEGSNSEVNFTIKFDAVDVSDSHGCKIEKIVDVIGLSWNSTLTDMSAQAKDAADAVIREMNKSEKTASLRDALEIVAAEIPNLKLSTDTDEKLTAEDITE